MCSHNGTYSQEEALKMLNLSVVWNWRWKATVSFDLFVRDEASEVLNKYYAGEADNCIIC